MKMKERKGKEEKKKAQMQIEEINDIEEETREKKIGKRGIKMTEKIKEEKGD